MPPPTVASSSSGPGTRWARPAAGPRSSTCGSASTGGRGGGASWKPRTSAARGTPSSSSGGRKRSRHAAAGSTACSVPRPAARRWPTLRAGAVSGSVFVHEISEVQPGAALDYLAAVRETREPLLADHGHTLVGLYEVLMNDVEVVTIWAGDPAGHEALMRAADSGNDERFAAWHEQARAAGRTRLAGGAHDTAPRHPVVAGRLAVSPAPASGPLVGLRVIESSLLGPAELTSFLADLGADVIKVEPPQGDYVREMTWPIVEGESLHAPPHPPRQAQRHARPAQRPRRSRCTRTSSAAPTPSSRRCGPGALERARPRIRAAQGGEPSRSCSARISGYGMTGPYRDLPAHGIAFDTWAGVVSPAYDDDGFCYMPEHPSIGIHAGPALRRVRRCSPGSRGRARRARDAQMEVAQSDAAAYMDWYRIETWKAYERPESEVTGNPSDDYERRAPGTRRHAGRRPLPDVRVGRRARAVHGVASRRSGRTSAKASGAWTCSSGGRASKYADHARNNRELQHELRDIFKTKTAAEWIAFGNEVNTPIAPVNTPQTIADDPQFQRPVPVDPGVAARRRRDTAARSRRRRGAARSRRGHPRSASTPTRCSPTCSATTPDRVAALRDSGALG